MNRKFKVRGWVDQLIRPQVRHFEPYLPGRSIESVQKEIGVKRMIKLASNENPLGPSSKATQALRAIARQLYRYPDGASNRLREALARHWRVPVERVIVGAGSDELIELIGKTFLNPEDEIVVSEHAFIRFRMAGELMGCRVVSVPMNAYRHDLVAMGKAIHRSCKAVFIANPNNPTGTYNHQQELKDFLEEVREKEKAYRRRILVVVDEAYYEYAALRAGYPQTIPKLETYPNLVILRTFSKIYALAGLRVGYAFAHPAIIRALDRVRPPFNVSTAAQRAAEASLGDPHQVARGQSLVKREGRRLEAGLQELCLPALPSAGNFVLFSVAPRTGQAVFQALLRKGIIVRAMDEYEFPHHVRVTVGLPGQNIAFLNALKEVVG